MHKEIKIVEETGVKRSICENILRKLPEWFGIEKAIQEYIENAGKHRMTVMELNGQIAGFLVLKENTLWADEIEVMGVLPHYHRQGFGQKLILEAERYSRKNHKRFLLVKTLGPSRECENYKRTRDFYERNGFYGVEEIFHIWGPENPCFYMVKPI